MATIIGGQTSFPDFKNDVKKSSSECTNHSKSSTNCRSFYSNNCSKIRIVSFFKTDNDSVVTVFEVQYGFLSLNTALNKPWLNQPMALQLRIMKTAADFHRKITYDMIIMRGDLMSKKNSTNLPKVFMGSDNAWLYGLNNATRTELKITVLVEKSDPSCPLYLI